MDARTFGNYLSRMRKAQGLTQAELAEQLHVTDKAVSRWERGIGLPDINTLEPLADALGLTLADLMHCRAPEEADAAPTIPLEDFFTMLRRQHIVDWHSVRPAWAEHCACLMGRFGLPRHYCCALVWSWRWLFSGRRLDAFFPHFPVVRRH